MLANGFFSRLVSLKNDGESDYAFCKRIKLNLTTFHTYKVGGKLPRLPMLERIATDAAVSPGWLGFGEVPLKAHEESRT